VRRTAVTKWERRGFFGAGVLLVTSFLGLPVATVRADAEAAPLPSSFACPATIGGETLLKDSSLHNDSEVAAAGIYMPPGFRQLDCTYAIPNDANQGIKFNVQYFAQGDPNIGNDGICEKSYDAGGPVNGDTSLYFNSFVAGFDTIGDFYSTTKIAWTSFTVPGSAPALLDPVQQLTKEWFLESLALAGDCPGVVSTPQSSQPGTSNPTGSSSATPGAGDSNVVASGTEGPTPGELAIACAIILLLLGGGTGLGVHHHGVKKRLTGVVPPPPPASPSGPPLPPAPAAPPPNYIAGEFITDFIRDEVSMGTHVPPRDHFASLATSASPPPPERPGIAERIATEALTDALSAGYGHAAPPADDFTLGGPPPPPPPPVVPLDFSPQLVQSMLSTYVGPDHKLRVPSSAPLIAQLLNGFTMSDPVYASGSVSVALTDPFGFTETQVHMQLQAEVGRAMVKISSDGALPLSPDKARDYLQHLVDQQLGGKQVVSTRIDQTGIHLSLAG
jgi:hypothetical protein